MFSKKQILAGLTLAFAISASGCIGYGDVEFPSVCPKYAIKFDGIVEELEKRGLEIPEEYAQEIPDEVELPFPLDFQLDVNFSDYIPDPQTQFDNEYGEAEVDFELLSLELNGTKAFKNIGQNIKTVRIDLQSISDSNKKKKNFPKANFVNFNNRKYGNPKAKSSTIDFVPSIKMEPITLWNYINSGELRMSVVIDGKVPSKAWTLDFELCASVGADGSVSL